MSRKPALLYMGISQMGARATLMSPSSELITSLFLERQPAVGECGPLFASTVASAIVALLTEICKTHP